MFLIKDVQGTQNKVVPLELNVDTVYIRSNIRQEKDKDNNLYWVYDEQQLTFEEYFKKIIPEQEQAIAELTILLSEYQSQLSEALLSINSLKGE